MAGAIVPPVVYKARFIDLVTDLQHSVVSWFNTQLVAVVSARHIVVSFRSLFAAPLDSRLLVYCRHHLVAKPIHPHLLGLLRRVNRRATIPPYQLATGTGGALGARPRAVLTATCAKPVQFQVRNNTSAVIMARHRKKGNIRAPTLNMDDVRFTLISIKYCTTTFSPPRSHRSYARLTIYHQIRLPIWPIRKKFILHIPKRTNNK